jgi:hypothetical protein
MAKLRDYIVSFSPAERHAHGFMVKMSLMTGGTDHAVSAASFTDLEREVRRLAAEFGQTCAPYVRLKDRKERSPAGFDKWRDTVRIIDFVPAGGGEG